MRRAALAVAAMLLVASASSCAAQKGSSALLPVHTEYIQNSASQAEPQVRLNTLFYDKDTYARAILAPQKYEGEGRLTTAMLPHHLLAADMMTGVYSLAAKNSDSYDTVIIISPSHFLENCNSDIVTTTAGWNTPYGAIDADILVVETLLKNKLLSAEDNSSAVEKDHGVSAHIPFVRHYLPKARVAVCMVSNKISQEKLTELWRVLTKLCVNKRILLLASVDCSHYLLPDAAAVHDKETAKGIEAFDTAKLLSFTDSNIDSPQAVTSFLAVVKARGDTLKQLGHSNSTNYLPHSITNPIYDSGITTYFTYGAFN